MDKKPQVNNNRVPMGAFYNGTKVLIGTPSTCVGFFYLSIERNKKDYASGVRKRNHFEYNWEMVAKYNPNYLKHIEAEKRRLGAESDEFQMSYNLKWILERGMFITTERFEKLGDISLGTSLCDYIKEHVVGIDFGKKNDSTVVTVGEVDWENPILVEKSKSDDPSVEDFIVYDVTVKAWLEIQGDDWDSQYHSIMSFMRNFTIKRIVADATGVGSGIVDRIRANVTCEVWDFVFSTPAKSDLYKHYDMQLKAGRVHYPADEETKETLEYQNFVKQHLDLEKGYSGQNLVVAHPSGNEYHDDYCFTESTKVSVINKGLVSIKDVEIDDLVYTHNNRWMSVTKLYTHDYRGNILCNVSAFYFGSSECTPNHPFLTDRGFVPAEGLTLEDKLIYKFDSSEQLSFTEVDLLPIFEKLAKPSKINRAGIDMSKIIEKDGKLKFNNPKSKLHNRFITINSKLFKLLGYYLSEGSCGSHNIQFTFNSNEVEYHNEVKSLLVEIFGIEAESIGFSVNKNNSTTVYTSSRVIREFFKEIIGENSTERRLPQWILTAPKDMQVELLKSYWNGDGSSSVDSGIVFTTTSEVLAYQIRDLLLRFGIVAGMNIGKRKGKTGCIRGRIINHNADLYGVRVTSAEFYNPLADIIGISCKKVSKFHRPHARVFKDYVALEIRKIESIVSEIPTEVYNLEVAEDHSYTVQNSTVHNCDSNALMVYGARGEGVSRPQTEKENPMLKDVKQKGFYSQRNNLTARRR